MDSASDTLGLGLASTSSASDPYSASHPYGSGDLLSNADSSASAYTNSATGIGSPSTASANAPPNHFYDNANGAAAASHTAETSAGSASAAGASVSSLSDPDNNSSSLAGLGVSSSSSALSSSKRSDDSSGDGGNDNPHKIFVGNLPISATKEDILNIFRPYVGEPVRVDWKAGGFAFLHLEDGHEVGAQEAVTKLHNSDFFGNTLRVELAKPAIKCYTCGREGHRARECRNAPNREGGGRREGRDGERRGNSNRDFRGRRSSRSRSPSDRYRQSDQYDRRSASSSASFRHPNVAPSGAPPVSSYPPRDGDYRRRSRSPHAVVIPRDRIYDERAAAVPTRYDDRPRYDERVYDYRAAPPPPPPPAAAPVPYYSDRFYDERRRRSPSPRSRDPYAPVHPAAPPAAYYHQPPPPRSPPRAIPPYSVAPPSHAYPPRDAPVYPNARDMYAPPNGYAQPPPASMPISQGHAGRIQNYPPPTAAPQYAGGRYY